MPPQYTRRKAVRAAGAVIVGVGLAGCSGGDGDGAGGDTVEMSDELVFDPESISVAVGDTVTWENVGTVDHTVTAYEDQIPGDASYFASGGFDGEQAARDGYAPGGPGAIGEGERYRHTFETAGTFEYFCIPHESAGMVGTIEVQG